MPLKVISLELARDSTHPSGDPNHGYIVRAPLDTNSQLDRDQWHKFKPLCSVHRIANGLRVEVGLLILNKQGQWVISYAPGEDDDEGIFRLGDHRFIPGEYISITEHDKIQRTFKVRSVDAWHPNPAAADAQ